MTVTRELVRLSGTLRGPKGTASCNVSATRVTLSGTRLSKDCMYVIEWVSMPLPAGDYSLKVGGKTLEMHHSKDGWRIIQPEPKPHLEAILDRTESPGV
jgi:hypothetical protein